MVAGGHATIADNDFPPPPATVSVSASPATVTEGNPAAARRRHPAATDFRGLKPNG